ncbi:MAG: methyltransferase domain-containing protein [Bacteroidia bacterium]
MNKLDAAFWQSRYTEGSTGWDIGYPSPPLKKHIDALPDRTIKVLIPGCGNAYEAGYMYEQGFSNVYIIDIAPAPIEQFKAKFPGFPSDHILLGDFFQLNQSFDLVLEQTFFCALDPSMREDYVKKMAEIIKPSGKLAGLLFSVEFEKQGPPFGGSKQEYLELFNKHFNINKLEDETNSIPPRAGNEVFIEFIRP